MAYPVPFSEHRCPYLKTELLRDNPNRLHSTDFWRSVVEGFARYDSSYIDEYLEGVGYKEDAIWQ